jgi:acyl-CoA thioesterase
MSEPYADGLGVRVESADGARARLRVPFQDGNSNPGGALHGGVAASVIDVAAGLVGQAGAEDRPGVEHGIVDLAVTYLAAAIHEDIVAEARVLRRGKELAFVEVDVRTDAGKGIARGLVTHRSGEPGGADRQLRRDPAPFPAPHGELPGFTRFFTTAPFMARLGIEARHAADGTALTSLPWREGNAGAAGALHGGAVAALIDTTGAMASWSLVPLDPRNKASTPALHVTHHAPAGGEAVEAEARTLRRTDELFHNAVTVRGARSGRLVATGTVLYRIVVP